MSTASSGPYVLVRSRSSRDGVGARLDGWIPRTPSRGYGGGTSGRVGCRLLQGGRVPAPARRSGRLGNSNGARADPTKQELRNLNGAGADPTEQELRNLNDVGADPTEQELGNLNGTGAYPTEQELGNSNYAGADPTEQELGNLNGAGADPTEQELGNLNDAGARELEWRRSRSDRAGARDSGIRIAQELIRPRANPIEQELGNLNDAEADPTEQELGNLNDTEADLTEHELGDSNCAGADPTEQELGNLNGAGADPTEQKLENLNLGFCREGEPGHKSWGFGREGEFGHKSWGFGREGEFRHKSWGFGREGELADPCSGRELQDPMVGGNDHPEPVEGRVPDDGVVCRQELDNHKRHHQSLRPWFSPERLQFGTAGRDIPQCRVRIPYESDSTFFCHVARGATSLGFGPSRAPFLVSERRYLFGISGRVAGGRSISDQKNLDDLSPVKNAWMARDGWRSGIPWTYDVNYPTNWERGSSLP
ncbi:hypothetical protein BHM03_00030420 [Ensete ventricosum]|nr:hypothetical protein BHM03_00030420 [Ensete ventricosum]